MFILYRIIFDPYSVFFRLPIIVAPKRLCSTLMYSPLEKSSAQIVTPRLGHCLDLVVLAGIDDDV